MMARVLGSFCLFVSALPLARHLGFLPLEMWCFAILVGGGTYLFTIPQQKSATQLNPNSE